MYLVITYFTESQNSSLPELKGCCIMNKVQDISSDWRDYSVIQLKLVCVIRRKKLNYPAENRFGKELFV
jgi:hypothetical protein